jgi:hypothetical protein
MMAAMNELRPQAVTDAVSMIAAIRDNDPVAMTALILTDIRESEDRTDAAWLGMAFIAASLVESLAHQLDLTPEAILTSLVTAALEPEEV